MQLDGNDQLCSDQPLERRVEAILMSADRPISDSRLAEALGLIVRKRPQSQSEDATGSEQQEVVSEEVNSTSS